MLSAIPSAARGGIHSNSPELFDYPELLPQGELHCKLDQETGLRALVAIHNTRLGPALGGCRCLDYPSTQAAIEDALRLARGMSYKAAISKLSYGGGKAVLMRPARIEDREAFFETFGRFVETLGGRYITAEDAGTGVKDMDAIARTTRYVVGTSKNGGDPSPFTALGVRYGIEAAVKFRLHRDSLEGLKVAIQGLGHVGYALAQELAEQGARLIISDTKPQQMERCADEFHAEPVSPSSIYATDCEVFAPCALGGCINDNTLKQLRAAIVAGSANNQLAEGRHGLALHRRRILYAPDYVINAGGLMQVTLAHKGAPRETVIRKIHGIYDNLLYLFDRAAREDRSPAEMADALAEERLYGKTDVPTAR